MTFRRSLRMIAKRWWLLLVGGVVVAALAFLVAGQKQPHYMGSTNITLNDQTVGPNDFGPGLQLNPALPKFTDDWTLDDFLSMPAAITASGKLGGSPSATQIYSGLNMNPLSTTRVQLTYTGGSNRDRTVAALKAYATAFI